MEFGNDLPIHAWFHMVVIMGQMGLTWRLFPIKLQASNCSSVPLLSVDEQCPRPLGYWN